MDDKTEDTLSDIFIDGEKLILRVQQKADSKERERVGRDLGTVHENNSTPGCWDRLREGGGGRT